MKIYEGIKDAMRRLLAPAEDPRVAYPNSGHRHDRLIEQVHQARSGLDAARSRLEAHISAVRRSRLPSLNAQPQNPFQEQLAALISEELADLEAELILLDREEQALVRLEEHLNMEEQVLLARQQAAEAHQVVSAARSKAQDQIGAAIIDLTRFDKTMDQAEQRALSVEAKVAAASRVADLASTASDKTDSSRMLTARYAVVASQDNTEDMKRLVALGFRSLIDLEWEFRQLCSLFDSFRSSNLLVSDRVQLLVSETYRQGVSVLADALSLTQSLQAGGRHHISLDPDHSTVGDGASESSESSRTDSAGEVAELVDQARRCMAALSQTRIEMTAAADRRHPPERRANRLAPADRNRGCEGDSNGAPEARPIARAGVNAEEKTMLTDEPGDMELVPSTQGGELSPLGAEPLPPRGMAEDESASIRQKAADVAARLLSAEGSDELQVIDEVSDLGLQVQRNAASELGLLRARLGELIEEGGAGAAIAGELAELRKTLAKISPDRARPTGFLPRVLHVGILGRSTSSVVGALERIAIGYEPASKQIAVIEGRLREGRALLTRDNIELRKLYEAVEIQHAAVLRQVYLGETLLRELQAFEPETKDALKRERILNTTHDLMLRVQDLRTMAEVDLQFFVSIDMTRLNNTRLGQAVERTLALSTNVVMVGLALQVALSRQRRVLEANQRTREFLASVIATNAALMKQHTAEISDAYNNPIIAMDRLTQAHNDLVEALDIAEHSRQEGMARARQTIAEIVQISNTLELRAASLLDQNARLAGTPKV